MPTTCFVPGCKSGYASQIKENARLQFPNPAMFSAPSDRLTFLEWKRQIARADKELSFNSIVCELHFEEDCIIRFEEFRFPDGTVHRIPRKVALKRGSVPTIFPHRKASRTEDEKKKPRRKAVSKSSPLPREKPYARDKCDYRGTSSSHLKLHKTHHSFSAGKRRTGDCGNRHVKESANASESEITVDGA